MVKREKVKKVIEILKKVGRVQRNQLIRIIVEEYEAMSHQTANDAINEGIELRQIFREEAQRGKQKIVWLSASPEVSTNEKTLLKELEEALERYDKLFFVFREKYRSLTTEQKADGVDVLLYFIMQFNLNVDSYTTIFGRTRKWTNFMQEIPTRLLDVINLCKTDSKKVFLEIFQNMIVQRAWDLNDAFIDIEEFLEELKK